MLAACKKNESRPSEGKTTQFHKSISSGETYYQQPEIIYSATNDLGEPSIVYWEDEGYEHSYLKWVQFKENGEPVFKKMLRPSGDPQIFWQTGFARTNNNEYVFSGSLWRRTDGFGDMFIATANESGQLLKTKVISANAGNKTIRGDKIFTTHDNGYLITSFLFSPCITKLNSDAVIEWSVNLENIKSTNRYFTAISSLTETKQGDIILALTNNSGDEYIMKMSAVGEIIWLKEYKLSNIDGHYEPINIKYLVADENDNIYAFEEYFTAERILIIKTDKNGGATKVTSVDGDCRSLYDLQYTNQAFFLLTGTDNVTRCLHIQLNKELEIQKKGVVLSVGDLSSLPGKFFKSKDGEYTSFIIAGLDEDDKTGWQFLRLNNEWKYPCFNYTMPEFSISNHSEYETTNIDLADIGFSLNPPSDYITTDDQFIMSDFSISNMEVTDYCK